MPVKMPSARSWASHSGTTSSLLRVVDILEKDGQGLNLSHEVRLGILGHTGEYVPETLEGQIVRKSDQMPISTTTLTTPCGQAF